MRTNYEVYSNGIQLTNSFFTTEEEAIHWIDFRGLTNNPYEIRKVYIHIKEDPAREWRAEKFVKHREKYEIISPEQWKKEYFEQKAERKRKAEERKAEKEEKIKAKALKK